MSDLRLDPLNKRWVVIAPERSDRPGVAASLPAHAEKPEEKKIGFCPFCPGNEDKTPPEIFAVRHSGPKNSQGWIVRVVSNKYPTLQIEGNLDRKAEGIYDRMRGVGAHEVIIEGPGHWENIHQMPFDHARLVLHTAKGRMLDLEQDKRFRYLLLFKNYGLDAGASLIHPHMQLNAFPVTPFETALELQASRAHFEEKERCLLCDIADHESAVSLRVIVESLHLIAFAPYASRFPYEVMIMPKSGSHAAYFTEIDDLQLSDLVQVLQIVLKKLEIALVGPSYNLVLHTAPFFRRPKRFNNGETIRDDYHWHLHVYPRTTKIAGFELGAQFFINPVIPELAAKNLREVAV